MTQHTTTSVYLYYDQAGVLIYVGITSRATRRQQEHNADKDWWHLVAAQRVEHFPTREEAAQRERELIVKHRPPFNRIHNPDAAAQRELYLAVAPSLAAINVDPPSAKSVYHEVHGRVPLTQIESGRHAVFAAAAHFHDLLIATTHPPVGVILRAPRKIGTLVRISPNDTLPTVTFAATKGTIRPLRDVVLTIKHQHGTFVAHEAVGAE